MSRASHARNGIRELIAHAKPGDRLPSEAELATQLGVSRVTVRQALERLWHEGRVTRIWGNGTFVSGPVGTTPAGGYRSTYVDVDTVGSLPGRIRAAGLTPEVTSLAADRVPAEPWVRALLPDSPEVWRVVRILTIEGVPGLHITDFVPTTVIDSDRELAGLGDTERDLPSIFAAAGTRVVKDEATLAAVIAADHVASGLNLSAGAPVLRARQTSQSDAGKVIACAEVIYNTDVFSTVLVRSVGDG